MDNSTIKPLNERLSEFIAKNPKQSIKLKIQMGLLLFIIVRWECLWYWITHLFNRDAVFKAKNYGRCGAGY